MTADLLHAVEANPQDLKAFEALIKACVAADDRDTLEIVYAKVPRWAPEGAQSPMVRVLSQHARTAASVDLQTWLNYKNGLLLWKGFGDQQMAEMAFRRVETLPNGPESAELLRSFYVEFYSAQNNWRRLEQVLSEPQKGGIEDPVEARRFLARLAEEKKQDEKAIQFWQELRKLVPEDDEAEQALRRLYAAVGKWHAMVELLKERFDRLGPADVDDKILLLMEMIDIYKGKMNAAAKVVSSWQAILEIDHGNVSALDALAAEYTEMKRWPDLVKVLQQKVEHESNTKKLVELHTQIAGIMIERFSNTSEAIKHYEAILSHEPENREAIRVLKDIYDQRRDYDAYVAISEREIGLLGDGKERHKRLVELAKLASEKLRKPHTPIALWERVLEAEPNHHEALTQLEGWFEREKNWARLAEVLEQRVALEKEVATQVHLLDTLGVIASTRLEDQARAADVWRQILVRDRDHRKAQTELKKKYIAEHDWDGLEWFFRNYGDIHEWVRTLEGQVKAVEESEEKVQLLYKAAAVWRDELKDTRRAVKNLEAVLELEPRHAETARMLVPIYTELGSWRELPNVYEIALEATEDTNDRRDLLLKLADVQEQKLDNTEAAFFAYVQAVSENPSAVELHGKLKQLAEGSSNWESYVYVLQDAVDHIELDQSRVEVLLEIGNCYRDRLGAPETALTFFNRVLAFDPYNRVALDRAEAAFEATGRYDQLIVIYQKRLGMGGSADERMGTLFRLANTWRHLVKANDEAEAVLLEMLEDFPSEQKVHDALIEIYLEEARYAELREVLEKKCQVLTTAAAASDVLADIECQLGMLTYGTFGDDAVSAAIDRYEAALKHDAHHETSIAQLEQLLTDEGERLRISKILGPVYENRMAWGELSQMLELQVVAAQADDDTQSQIELLTRLTALYQGRLRNDDLAWRTYGRLFALRPEGGDVRGAFQALTTKLDRWKELVTLYSWEADQPADKESRLAIKLEVARAWHQRLGSLEDARVYYHKVRDEESEHQEAIDALEHIYVELDRAEDLLKIYRDQIDLAADLDKKIDYLFRTSDLLRERLERLEDAIRPAEEALALRPGDLGAIQRLDELFTATEKWEELAQTLEDTIQIVAADPARIVTLKVRLAGVWEQHLDRPDTAIDLYASVFELDANNEDVVEALERLFQNEELAPSIAPILQPFYERTEQWNKLVDVCAVREGAAVGLQEKVDWNYRIAGLFELELGQAEQAFQYFEAAANLDPASERTVGELLRLADGLDNHGELIHFLQSIVEEIPSTPRRIETHRTIAFLARDKTRDLAGAEKQFRAILDIDPGDMPATDALIALYRETSNHASLVELLLKKAPMAGVSLQLRNDLYAEAGDIAASVLNQPEQAIEICETLHSLDPSGDRALDALEALYERTEDWENLVRIYREKIDRASDTDGKKQFAFLMGHVQADKVGSADDAIATWHQVLGWDPAEREALGQLDRLYTLQGDWFNLKEILRKLQGLGAEGVSTAEWEAAQFRIAKLYENGEQLADVGQAIEAYGALLDRNPEHAEAANALAVLLAEQPDHAEKAFGVLRPNLELREDFEELWNQYEVLAGHFADEPEKKVTTLHAMADVAEIRLGDAARALDAQARAFVISPRNERTVAELERLAETHGFWEGLVGIYLDQAGSGEDDILALALRLKAGAILMDRIGDAERASATYAAVYQDHPEHLEAQGRLHRLYEARELWPELAGVLRQQADTEAETGARIVHLEKLAKTAEEKLGDAQGALAAYTEILDLDRTSPLAVRELRRLFEAGVNPLDIAERLEPIYRDAGRWDELDSLLELKLSVIDDPVDRLQLMRDLARLALDKRERPIDALDWYGRAFQLDTEDDGLLTEMDRLAGQTSEWTRLVEYVWAAAEVASETERKVALWQRAAAAARDQINDPAEAERIFRLVLAVEPHNVEALRAVDKLLVAADRAADLEPILVAETAADDLFDDERVTVWTRLAELYRDRLARRVDAVHAWRQVLELQEMNEGALRALQTMYLEDEQWPELFDILQRLADLSRDPAQRVDFFADMANIAETALANPKRAIELWEEVLVIKSNDDQAVHELERLLEGEENWQGLAEAYERELRMGTADKERRLTLFKALGRLWQGQLDDPFQAQGAWERARAEEPFDREALDALRGLHQASGNDQARAEILEAALASENYDQPEQLALWRELAEVRTDVFGDRPAAIEAWRAVLALETEDAQAIENLETLYENTGRWSDLVELFRKKLDLIPDEDDRVETWLQIGQIQQDNLQSAEDAAQTYRDVLAFRPSELEASRRLEVIYESLSQWRQLAELLLDRGNHLAETDDKLQNCLKLATVYEQRLSAPEDAFIVLETANQLVPEDAHVLAELERLAAVTALWKELHEVYEATLAHLEDDLAISVMLKSATVVRDRLSDAPAAITLFERALAAQTDNEQALRALIALDESEQRWQPLVDVLYGLAEVTPDYAERGRLFRKIAEVQELKLASLDKAVKAWEEALDLDETDKECLSALERLQIARRDWKALIAIYDRRCGVEPERETELRLQIGGILEQYLRQIDDAIEVYEEVLRIDPSNEVALARLEALYGEREDYDRLLDVYERAYDAARTDEERLRMAKNAAILHEGYRNDLRSAAEQWQRVLALKADDLEAFEALVKIYTERREWDDLIKIYELRYETADASDGRADALRAMAEVYRDRIDDVDNAIQMYERVLLERRTDRASLDALDGLYATQGQWDQVLENIERKLEQEKDLETRVGLLCRQGEVAASELSDHYRAAASYGRVLKEAPGNATAVDALLELYRSDERWDKVVETLTHKLQYTKSPIDLATLHVVLAETYSEKLNQPELALQHFEAAERSDPESRRALEALADHYMRTASWEKAMTRLEALVDRTDPNSDKALLASIHKRLGLCAEALYLDDQAVEDLEMSARLVPADLDTLRALGRIHYKRSNFREAERYLQEVLDKYKRDLSSDEQVKVLMQLGESALKSKSMDKAQMYLKQVVAAQPNNPQAIENIITVLKEYGEWQNMLRYQEQLLTLKTDKLERYKIYLEMGEVYLQHVRDRKKAIEAYRGALDLDIFPKQPALKLVEIHLSANEFDDAIRNLNRLIKLEDEPKRKAQFAYMAAVVYRDQLQDPNEAVKYFNLSLDHNTDNLQAFRIVDELLTKGRDWKALEQNYRRMIQRVRDSQEASPSTDAILFKLFEGLGEIYRSRLKQLDKAVASFELAREKRPDEQRIREILASLYEVSQDGIDKAITEHRWLIAQRPDRFESYHKLVELYRKAQRPDAAWCTAGLLVTLGQAGDAERAFYDRYLASSMADPNRVIDHTTWGHAIMSRMEDPELGRVLEIVYIGLGKNLAARNRKEYAFKKKNWMEADDELLIAHVIRNVLKMFGMQAPEIYKGEEPSGIEILLTNPPILRIGTDFHKGRSEKELAFIVAKRLTYFQPAHVIANLYPREALESLYLGAASLVDPAYQIPMKDDVDPMRKQEIVKGAADIRAILEKSLTPQLRQQLSDTMRSYWKRSPTPDLGKWHRAIELTANHAGLMACGDIALVGQLLKGETIGLSKLKSSDKLKDIVHYIVSEPYLQLRKQLNLQIDYSDLLG